MKKLVIAALAIGAMAACTKSNVQFEQPGEISLQPVAQKATKAAVDGTTYPTSLNFNVWAWWGADNAGTELEDFTGTTPYIAGGTFVHRKDNSWGGATPYYWPTKGSLVFAGYSPVVTGPTFNYILQDKKFTVENYIQSNKIDETVDLMWFDVTAESYNQNSTDSKGVPVAFHHALSWLTFKFNLQNTNQTAEKRWTITGVKLTGIENKGSFTAVKDVTPTCTWTTPEISENGMDEISVFSGSYTVAYVEGGTVLPNTDVVVDGTNVLNNAVLVIPQSCAPATPAVDATPAVPAAAELVITYNMKTYVGEGVLTGQEVRLPLNVDENKWLPGKHYIYTITFGANEILIAPTVTEWETVNVDPINVQ